MSDRRPILALDFDGVLHGYQSGWQGARHIPDPPVDGAIAFLAEAVDVFEVAIHSSRSRYWGGRRAMRCWLERQLVDYFWIGEAVRQRKPSLFTHADYEEHYTLAARYIVRRISFPLWKPAAHVTIDDRAITFTGTWPSMEELRAFKPWNKLSRPAHEVRA